MCADGNGGTVAQQAAYKLRMQAGLEDDDSSEEDIFEEEEDDDETATPLDWVDPFLLFRETVNTMSLREPQRLDSLKSNLPNEVGEQAQAVLKHAETRSAPNQATTH